MSYGSSFKNSNGVSAEQPVTPVRQSSSYTSSAQVSTTLPETEIDRKRKSFNSSIKFPRDLGTDFYISFNAFKYSSERPSDQKRTFTFEQSVALPIPTNLTDSFSAGYSSENLYFAGDALKNQLSTDLRKEGIGGTVSSYASKEGLNRLVGSVMDTVKKTDPGQVALGFGVYGLDKMPGPGAAAIKSSLQLTTNPFPVMIFQGTNFKPAFNFDWTLYPESEREAKDIRSIVGFFRREMLPERTQNSSILRTPSIFEIKITPTSIARTFKRCVLTNMGINYAPNGPSFLYSEDQSVGGTEGFTEQKYPSAVSLSLTFQEIEIWLANDYQTDEFTGFDPLPEFTK